MHLLLTVNNICKVLLGAGLLAHDLSASAQVPTNSARASRILLFNGWSLSPAGTAPALLLGDLPLNMQLSRSGRLLAVTNNGQSKQSIQLIDPCGVKLLDEAPIRKSWYGLWFSAAGRRLHASGGNDNTVLGYGIANQKLTPADTLRLSAA